jgi:hypothetical protein
VKALPAPQRDTVPAILSARFVAPLTQSGYDFGALDAVTLPDIAGAYLHRVVGYSFALEVPEDVFIGSVESPFLLQLENVRNGIGEFAKPIRLARYIADAPALEYIRTPQKDNAFRARLTGRLAAGSVGLLGFATVSAVVSFHIQSIQDSEWIDRFEKGEI